MIKFFRKIRQNLLSEGKFKKYTKYAIGEILLVVIGILIAVQINNWNGRYQDEKKEILNLTRLTTNLGYDKRLYESIIKEDSILITKLNEVEKDVSGFINTVKNPIEDLNFLIIGYKFTSNRTTIDNLVSSGQIGLLRSNYLVEDIFLYYRTAEYMAKGIDESIHKYNKDDFSNLIFEFNTNAPLNPNYINKFENSVRYKVYLIEKQIAWYREQKDFAEKLITKINNEIRYIKG
ncbi:DUF6090 family protein [Aquimarina litoralis]|uniref:DUF6090 family protein n=1 Tax=Aquimarina litoralis TaxID=584605 RepID=UPI001C55BB45|nr:DUF6090 family protein [Aquimarina litoralis]MBW1294786.1 hypothetical protein [Aquimarina litoralis]